MLEKDNYDIEELNNQIDFNKSQLHSLYIMSRNDTFNIIFCFIVLFGLLIALGFFLMTFVIPGFEIYIRKEIVEYTGSIVVFIIMGVIKISKFLIESWLRKNTISSLIVQQKSAISYAQRTLNEDGFNI
ncbi:MAG: hypothetical protein QX203_00115 [Methylococcaceae bacterium]